MLAQRLILSMVICLGAASVGLGMQLQVGTVESVKSDPGDYYIDTYLSGWALSGDIVTWIDRRDGWSLEQIFGTHLSDPSHVEFPVDTDPNNSFEIDMDYPLAAYSCDDSEENTIIRIADISDEQAIATWDIPLPNTWVYQISIDGNYVSFICEGESIGIYVTDIANPAAANTHLIDDLQGLVGDKYVNDTALDGDTLAWCGDWYDSVNDEYQGFFGVADITDPANPLVHTVILPDDGTSGWDYNYLSSIDISGDWMAASGKLNGASGVFAIRNFTDPDFNNWEIVTLMALYGSDTGIYVSEPRIDGSIVVWTRSGGSMPSGAASEPIDMSHDLLMGANLINSGHAVTTVLRTAVDNETFDAADVSGANVVWSRNYYDSSYETQSIDYFKGVLELECGDWGYMHGDLDRDCDVDLTDFAMFAESWLACTTPEVAGCRSGDIFIDL